MKKRNSVLLACGLTAAMLAAASGAGLLALANATDGWSDSSVGSEYAYKSVFELENRTYSVGGNSYGASALLCYPDGTVSEEKQAVLDQVGVYTVKYSVAVGEKVYADSESFVVNYPHYDVGNSKSSVRYATPDRATNAGVVAKIAQGDSLVFTQYIDFTRLPDTENLVKGYVVPDVAGANDFTELVFTFTDSADASVYFQVHYYAYDWTYNTYVAANGQNQVPVGVHQNQGVHEDDGSGLWSYVSFKSAGQNGVDAPDATQLFISMNYAEKKVYTMGYPGQKSEIVDLDDVSLMKNVWTGFPSGKARLSVNAYNYTGATATVCFTEVYGIDDLSKNEFIDTDAPTLTVDDEYEGNMPPALKGYSYEIPAASAYDAYAYGCDVKVSVWYNYGADGSVSVPVRECKFVTDRVGTYGIVYEAYDKVGNRASTVRYVVAYDTLSEAAFELPAEAARSAKQGEWVQIFDIDESGITGGSGKKTVNTYLEINGTREAVSGGFRATEKGTYRVIYAVTDYVGKVTEKSYEVTVGDNDRPVLEQDYDVYPAYISGGEYAIPAYYAYVAKNGKLERELCSVQISDGNGNKICTAGDRTTVSVKNNGDPVKFTVTCNGVTLAVHEAVGITAWMKEEAGTRFHLENYLVGEGFTTEKTPNGMVLTATEDAMRFTFANALSSGHFTMRIGGLKGAAQGATLCVKLFDAADRNAGIVLTLGGGSTAYAETEGVRYALPGSTFGENGTFEITYAEGALTVNGREVPLNGFEGFAREKIFLAVEYAGYGDGAGLTFAGVGNCNFNTAQTDRFAPMILPTHEAGGVQPRGGEYVLYAPVAYDVYSPDLEYYLTVTAPDGSFVKDENGVTLDRADPTVDYVVRLDDIGAYKVVYDVAEAKSFVSRQNNASLTYTLIVEDEESPTILWKGDFPAELTAGEMFVLPEYEVSDNYSSAENVIVRVFVETPANQLIMLPGNSIRMTHEGTYEIRVMAVDEAGNITSYVKHVNVTGAK